MLSSNPTLFIVGAGRVGTALACGFRSVGAPILGIWSRSRESARDASGASGVACYAAAPPDVLLDCDCIILAVSDGAIQKTAQLLVDTGLVGKKHVLLHCSGSLSAAQAFGKVTKEVFAVGTFHPLRAISKGTKDWSSTVFGIEGDAGATEVGTRLAKSLGGSAMPLKSEQMAAYHAGASMASNLVAALLSVACDSLTEAGLERTQALGALASLAASGVEQIKTNGLPGGLTGPIRRGDVETVERHLGSLQDSSQPIYRALAQVTLAMARELGEAPQAALDRIQTLLEG